MRLFPPCEVMTRRSGLRLLTIWGLGGGGGDLAGTTFPRLLPLETVRRPGEALALVYPLAAGRRRCEWTEINRKIKQVKADGGVQTVCPLNDGLHNPPKGFFVKQLLKDVPTEPRSKSPLMLQIIGYVEANVL